MDRTEHIHHTMIIDKTLLDASTRKALENIEKPAPTFKVGDWVRFVGLGKYGHAAANVHMGKLGEVRDVHNEGQSFASVSVYNEVGAFTWGFDQIEPALPRAGEVWTKVECVDHPARITGTGHFEVCGDGSTDVWARCGCFVPLNFGRGEAK